MRATSAALLTHLAANSRSANANRQLRPMRATFSGRKESFAMNKFSFTLKSLIPLLVVLALLIAPIAGVARAEDETPAAPEAVTETTSDTASADTSTAETTGSDSVEAVSAESVTEDPATASEPAPVEATTETAPTESPTEIVTESTAETVIDAPTEAATETTETIETGPAEVAVVETPAEVIAVAAETGNEVVVLDEAGAPVPLATEQAVAIIVNGDPMWCPTGVLPGGAGCTSSFSAFTGTGGLLAELQTNSATYTGDGTIYISRDYDSTLETGDIYLDGNVFTSLGAITLQGGWDFGTNALDATTDEPYSYFGGLSVGVVNWTNDVTLNNLFLFGGLGEGTGLEVTTTGDISVDSTSVQLFDGMGASLVNSDGNGNVSVANSFFTNNTGDGLYVESAGNINVDNINAASNHNDGADLRAFGLECDTPEECAETGNISVANSIFEFNGLVNGIDFGNSGLVAQGTQDIYATNVTADFNGGDGASYNSGAILSVVIEGGDYSNNGNNGIEVDTNGNITIRDVVANQNVNNGAALDSANGSGNDTISISNSVFNQNGQDVFDENDPEFTICFDDFSCNGIYAEIDGGNISLFNVTASENYNNGAVLDNTFSCEDSDCIEPSTGSIIVSHSDLSGNGQLGGFEDECGEDNQAGIAFNGALACEGLVTFADDNSIVAVNCSTIADNYNYGAELYFDNGGLLSLNGNVFAENGLGDLAIREGGLVGQTEGQASCVPPSVETEAVTGSSARVDPLNCNFTPDGATTFETEAQIARLYNLPGPLMIACFPDGSLNFWHVVNGVGVQMSGYAAPGWEQSIGAGGFIFDQFDSDGFRVTFRLVVDGTALGLPELGGSAAWYEVKFFAPSGELLVEAYLPIER